MFVFQHWNGLGWAIVRVGLKETPARQNGATIRVTSLAIIEVRPAALGQIWHPPGNHK